uniref:Uncharacterized protein n=1 Tax=Cacopsylla melanoneura TaxID=428564 RepID=A0A8D8M0V1_9HEMI
MGDTSSLVQYWYGLVTYECNSGHSVTVLFFVPTNAFFFFSKGPLIYTLKLYKPITILKLPTERAVTCPSTIHTRCRSTSVIEREPLYSTCQRRWLEKIVQVPT